MKWPVLKLVYSRPSTTLYDTIVYFSRTLALRSFDRNTRYEVERAKDADGQIKIGQFVSRPSISNPYAVYW